MKFTLSHNGRGVGGLNLPFIEIFKREQDSRAPNKLKSRFAYVYQEAIKGRLRPSAPLSVVVFGKYNLLM